MNTSFFQDMLGSIAERGRALLERSPGRPGTASPDATAPETLEFPGPRPPVGPGEASGVALARQLLDRYAAEPMAARIAFFRLLAEQFDPDPAGIGQAWESYRQDASPDNLQRLLEAVEPPRQELFRRLNLAPGGTAALVAMREDLLKHGGKEPALRKVDDDFAHLFGSWFNRGFLVAAPDRLVDAGATSSSGSSATRPCTRSRAGTTCAAGVQPSDRRCFGFFHPSLIDEPLIFVEVALTREIPGSIQALLAEEREVLPAAAGDDGGVLLDQQLPARAARRLVRQLPDQAGGRGAVARAALAHDLRHPVAGARVRGLARQARHHPATRTRCWRQDAAAAPDARPGRSRCCRLRQATSSRPRATAASRSIPWPASTSATAPASSASTGWATLRPRACARPRA